MKKNLSRLGLLLFGIGCLEGEVFAVIKPQDQPKTVAESSDFQATSTSQQVVDFVDQCAQQAEHVQKIEFGETVEGRQMVAAIVARGPYELGQEDERAVVLVIGNIHSGECAGKEGLLMLLRELTHNPEHPWLENLVVIIAPNYNADGNDRMGKMNRPGQDGPVDGMGRRENAQNLDLNRDFMKIDSPEAQALVGLMDRADPDLFIDCHTTNGSRHQYGLTYDIPHNPAVDAAIRDFMRVKMMPEVTRRMEKDGTLTFYYGNLNREKTSWSTYGYEPRYSTEYGALRGRMTILSEAYAYNSYHDRIMDSKKFVTHCIDYLNEHHEPITSLLADVDRRLIEAARTDPQRIPLSLAAKLTDFSEPVTIKGYDGDEKVDLECQFFGRYESTATSPMPYAYLIPSDYSRQVDRLLKHGIRVEALEETVKLPVEIDRVVNFDNSKRVFQRHKMVQLETERQREEREIPEGTLIVPMDQPLAKLAGYLLESESDDGLVVWNFFDDDLQVGAEYPVMRLPSPTKLVSEPIDDVMPTGKIDLDTIHGPNKVVPPVRAPQWVNGNQLETESFGRKLLMDAETGAISRGGGRSLRGVAPLLVAAGFEEERADSLAVANPTWSATGRYAVVQVGNDAALIDQQEKKAIRLGDGQAPLDVVTFSPGDEAIAFHDGQLNLWNLPTGARVVIGQKDAVSERKLMTGKLDWVYQEELYGRGNFKGYWWRPDSQAVAFLELDETGVRTFPIVDHLPVVNSTDVMSYPKAGDPNPQVRVGVTDWKSGEAKTNWVDLSRYGDEPILVSWVSWSPDGQQLLLQVQDRAQTWLDLVATDPDGKNPRVLFRDQTPAWIESPGEPYWRTDGSFLWLSPRDGYRHVYLYSADGKLQKQLTEGEWEVRDLLAFDAPQDQLYFSSAREAAYDLHVYRLDVKTADLKQLTTGRGTHSAKFSDDAQYFIDSHSSVDQPDQFHLFRADGTKLRRLNVSNDDRFEYLRLGRHEFGLVERKSEQPMDALVITPPDFDSAKKYPVLFHIYAGPQAPRVRNRFGGDWYLWHQMLAQQGYVIWMCDNRSASYRSSKHVWPIHRNLAENELKDIESGVEWLKKQHWVDPDRIGIWGWSYGGYMTAYAMTHSDHFKMGISGAPVTDWRNYDTIYTERLMGLPQDNPEGYEKTSVIKAAGDLHGKMLLIHGSIDENVHMSNSLQLAKALQEAGKQFELMIYPEARHSVRDPEQLRHLHQLMFDFVKENL
ncbi:MAG: DPP IV N-terminal domain-containing protein [Mariniblastus sp.]|nr:DPP IV N-terminal domain-containing protein [Mariniblastus sp.]